MNTINREEYKEILKRCKISYPANENIIDVYHKNNWDHFIMHWDEDSKRERCSYIDFFSDSKTMITFLKEWLGQESFDKCYLSVVCARKHKLRTFDDDVSKDIYNEFKLLINSCEEKINTSKAISMSKNEFIKWSDRFSFGGFTGVSEFSALIPELGLIILPYHHMNYLIYSNDYSKTFSMIANYLSSDLLVE